MILRIDWKCVNSGPGMFCAPGIRFKPCVNVIRVN